MTVEMRRAGPADVAAIKILVDDAYGKWVPLIGRKPWPMTVDYGEAVYYHDFLLLHIGEALAGLIETIRDDNFVVENLAVSPPFQKQGIADRLLRRAEQDAAALGYDSVRLYTNQRFAENIAFYQRRGYGIQSKENFPDGVLVNLIKKLASPC